VLTILAGCQLEQESSPPAGSTPPNTVQLTIIDTERVAEVDSRFLSFTVDSGQLIAGERLGQPVPPYDFTRSKLRKLAAELAPAYLRVGGSLADTIYYDMSAQPLEQAPAPYRYVLARQQWDAVCDFALDVGVEIMFTLNAGPGPRDADGLWIADNARDLIEYTLARDCPVTIWELGNEINGFIWIHGFDFTVSGQQYALDMAVARQLVDELHPAAKLAGPSSAFWPLWGESLPVLPEFMEHGGGLIDILSWHYYPQQSQHCPIASRRATPDLLLEPEILDEVNVWADHVELMHAQHGPQAEIWLGETGSAQCGGEPEVSDRFVSNFWWLDQLGQIALRGQPVVVRQTLSNAGYYELVSDETLEPNPDWYASVMFNRLMGEGVLQINPSQPVDSARSYVHCTPSWSTTYPAGAITVLVMNLAPDRELAVHFNDRAGQQQEVYQVTSSGIHERDVLLNGTELAVQADGSLPPLTALSRDGATPLLLPAASYAFVVFPEADAAACR